MASTQPLDTVRVRLQQCKSDKSFLKFVTNMIKQEGLLSPYKGLTYPLLFSALNVSWWGCWGA